MSSNAFFTRRKWAAMDVDATRIGGVESGGEWLSAFSHERDPE